MRVQLESRARAGSGGYIQVVNREQHALHETITLYKMPLPQIISKFVALHRAHVKFRKFERSESSLFQLVGFSTLIYEIYLLAGAEGVTEVGDTVSD